MVEEPAGQAGVEEEEIEEQRQGRQRQLKIPQMDRLPLKIVVICINNTEKMLIIVRTS